MRNALWIALCGMVFCGGCRAADLNLTVADNLGRAWTNEPIYWEIAFQPEEWQGGPVRVTRDGEAIPAQVYVAAQHPDGSVKTARVTFIIDQLEKDGKTEITAELGKAGPQGATVFVQREPQCLILGNEFTAIKLADLNGTSAPEGNFTPLVGVRTASGNWTGSGRYETQTAQPVESQTELLEQGPVRLMAQVTTTFDNGRTHVLTASLLTGSREVVIEEQFNLGPDDKYQFRQYQDDPDELAWEWWSWYGNSIDPSADPHPNYWVFDLGSEGFAPKVARYSGENASDDSKRDTGDGYDLLFAAPRIEKFLEPITWWRPDGVSWYALSPSREGNADVVALCAHSAGKWRNPNVLPETNITLRTRTNAIRLLSAPDRQVSAWCPIGLGTRIWSIRTSDFQESYVRTAGGVLTSDTVRDANAQGNAPDAQTALNVGHDFNLDTTRKWITDWDMTLDYPRLFIKPADKQEYYARLLGQGVGMPGDALNDFLRDQTEATTQKYYAGLIEGMDKMINGYFQGGANGYPGWMMGYWSGIVAAGGLDNLCGVPACTPEMTRTLKKKMAILTYMLTHPSNWPDKQANFGWGSMNMPVGRWGGLVVMASSINDHPDCKIWLKDADRYFKMLLQTEFAPDGTGISCPHYIGASSTSFYAWAILANTGAGEDVSKESALRNFARYYMQLMTPIDARWGIRTLLTEGDSRPGSSPTPGILANIFKESDPDLAGQLMQIWRDGGSDLSAGMGIPDALIIDPKIPSVKPQLGPEVFPGSMAVLRYRELGTPEEAYLTFLAGNFMIDHTKEDQLAFGWYEKGVPLTPYMSDMYVPGERSALTHNTLCWDVRPEGEPTPGKDQPGDYYHDHGYPWVDHVNNPRLHYEIAWDQEKQKITDTRGMVTLAGDAPGAALVEGQVRVLALAETPTKADYSPAMVQQFSPRAESLAQPFTWTRRLLYVKAPTSAGMNYLVVRDDTGDFAERTPSFNYWSLSEDVTLGNNQAHFRGQLGVDTDLFVTVPGQVKLYQDSFTHTNCEGIVSGLHQQKFGEPFSEKQVLARVEGQKGQGFLVTIFPRQADEPPPTVEPWLNGQGVKVTWQGETHYVLISLTPQAVDVNGIKANASCLVLKTRDNQNWSLTLPAGGEATYLGQTIKSEGPVEVAMVAGKVTKTEGKDLMAQGK